MKIDSTDSSIITVLEKNARLSFRKIAKKVGVSVATVMNRVNKLEKEGAIKRYSVVLDYDILEYDLQALISIIVSKGKLFQVEKKIASNPNVAAVYDITGHFDVIVLTRFKTRKALDSFLKKVQSLDFVEKTETQIILNTIKEDL